MSRSSPESAILDAAKRMQSFNALTQLVTIPWDDIDPQERNHWIGLACAALRGGHVQTPDQWKPIETAPKDGTKIDLLYAYPRGRTIDCMWREGGVCGAGQWIWLKPIWSSQPGMGIDWHLSPESDWEVCSYPNMEPTHWMPVPQGPDTSTDRTGK